MLAGLAAFLSRPASSSRQPERLAPFAATFQLASGNASRTWGRLTALRFPLCDGEVNATVQERIMDAPRWFFGGAREAQLLRYFRSLNLGSREREKLLDRRNWNITAEGIVVNPAESVVYAIGRAHV